MAAIVITLDIYQPRTTTFSITVSRTSSSTSSQRTLPTTRPELSACKFKRTSSNCKIELGCLNRKNKELWKKLLTLVRKLRVFEICRRKTMKSSRWNSLSRRDRRYKRSSYVVVSWNLVWNLRRTPIWWRVGCAIRSYSPFTRSKQSKTRLVCNWTKFANKIKWSSKLAINKWRWTAAMLKSNRMTSLGTR